MFRKILKWGLVAKVIAWLHRKSTDEPDQRTSK